MSSNTNTWLGSKWRSTTRRVQRMREFCTWPLPLWRLRGYAIVSFEGTAIKVSTTDYVQLHHTGTDPSEHLVLSAMHALLPLCGTFVDVGAHVGCHSLFASVWLGGTGHVHAFEPDRIANRCLAENLRLNRTNNVRLVPTAISAGKGTVTLSAETFGGSDSSIGRLPERCRFSQHVEVPTTSLDNYCAEEGLIPDLIKVDVEGAEDMVLAGAADTFSRATAVIVEVHAMKMRRDFRVRPEDFLDRLLALGKQAYCVGNDGGWQAFDWHPRTGKISDRFHLLLTNDSAARVITASVPERSIFGSPASAVGE